MSLPYPQIDPVLIRIGPLPIRWYALAYIAGIILGWYYAVRLIGAPRLWPEKTGAPVTRVQLDDLAFWWVALGVILGGRMGYVLFYEANLLISPWESLGAGLPPGILKTLFGWIHIPPALMIWRGGMSFHGGLIGVTVAGYLFARRYRLPLLSITDLFSCAAPIGLFFGRLANFINAELYGRATDVPWAMRFPTVNRFGEPALTEPRHPSQLYEAGLEGIVLFCVVAFAVHKLHLLKRPGATSGLFLAGYGLSRIVIENFREPDSHLPDFPLGLTMGMMLSLPMVLLGIWLIMRTRTTLTARRGET